MSCNEARYLTDAAIALGDELATGTCQPTSNIAVRQQP